MKTEIHIINVNTTAKEKLFPKNSEMKKRRLGILESQGKVTFDKDFKMSENEFLGF